MLRARHFLGISAHWSLLWCLSRPAACCSATTSGQPHCWPGVSRCPSSLLFPVPENLLCRFIHLLLVLVPRARTEAAECLCQARENQLLGLDCPEQHRPGLRVHLQPFPMVAAGEPSQGARVHMWGCSEAVPAVPPTQPVPVGAASVGARVPVREALLCVLASSSHLS